MPRSVLKTSANVLSLIGLSGIILAPAVASIAMDVALIYFCRENLKEHPFLTGMLIGSLMNRNSPGFFVPRINENGEFDSFEIGIAIACSAICTASCAIACAFLGSPMIAIAVAGAWAVCLGLYMLGEGLHGLAQEEKITTPTEIPTVTATPLYDHDIPLATAYPLGY